MAVGNLNRVFIAFSVPTIIAFSFLWFRRRWFKNNKHLNKTILPSDLQEHIKETREQLEQEEEEEEVNMQLIECAKNQIRSNEINQKSETDSDSFNESSQEIKTNINLLNDHLINHNNNNNNKNNNNNNEINVNNNKEEEEEEKEEDNLRKDADTKIEEKKVSSKLFSECFQSEKTAATTTTTTTTTTKTTRTRCETSGSGFMTCSSEAGSHNGTYSDIHSEGSCDSGKGSSDIQQCNGTLSYGGNGESGIVYQFELPQNLCGLLIGRKGFFIKLIKEQSDVDIIVNRHPFTPYMKICTIKGRRYQVKYALQMIRKRFPIEEHPNITLRQINVIPMSYPIPLPQSCQLLLPDGVTCDVILSCTVDAGHFFLQQPTHPTYPSLSRLDQFMTSAYNNLESPPVTSHVGPGIVCAVKAKEGWFRAVIINVYEEGDCEVKFVDYGGYSKIAITELRQIRNDFMTLPFQACECFLANVDPLTDEGWTEEANSMFEFLAQGQILQANIVSYSENNIPFVHLYMIQGASTVFINRELVNRGVAKWVDNL